MEFDTGASLSILSLKTYHVIARKILITPLEKSNICLKTYMSDTIKVQGATMVKARYDNQEAVLTIQVMDGAGPGFWGEIG